MTAPRRPWFASVAAAAFAACVAALAPGCGEDPPLAFHSLSPYPNPFGPENPLYSPQPHREKPLEVVIDQANKRALISLQGTPDDPGHHVAVVDLAGRRVVQKIEVGSGPTGIALHPGGRFAVVFNRFSNFASVIDLRDLRVVNRIPLDYYSIEGAFTKDGTRLYVANRWRDEVTVYDVTLTSRELLAHRREEGSLPTASNPRDLLIIDERERVAVASLTGMRVALYDTESHALITDIPLGAPANGLASDGTHLFIATTSASTHHLALEGPDTDGDGVAGDGTPNVNFQDLQNELVVARLVDGKILWRYTSDTLCCQDYRDVAPTDLARHGDLLPPVSNWIVGGSLPEQLAVSDGALFVTYSASNQVQRFAIDADSGALSPTFTFQTQGHAPHGIAALEDLLVVAHRLSETVGLYDARDGSALASLAVGDLSGGAFPATDAEIGELFNFVTSPFTVDGDQSCAHCHREDGNIDKAFSMPLARYAGLGLRMTQAYRGAADTRPWFLESSMDETNFKPVINEFARIENFCCSDYTMWPDGAPADCRTNPPAECATTANTSSSDGFDADRGGDRFPFLAPRPTEYSTRDEFFLASAAALFGRTESYGDGVYFEDPISGTKRPIRLDFNGMTRTLGVFLMVKPRLLPNPNPQGTAATNRGKALFESADVGCSTCHPAPAFTISTDLNPLDLPLRMGPVVSPMRDESGINLDLLAGGFVDTFPQSEMESCEEVCGAELCSIDPSGCDDARNVFFGVPSLRGLWDRAPAMLHDGRARGLREVLCTPGHPALLPGEIGRNERDGVADTHGGTSHLTPAQIEDLMTYILSL